MTTYVIANHPGFARILAGIRVFSWAPGKYLPAPGISRALPDQYIGGRSGTNPRHNTWILSYVTSSLATRTCIACVPSNTRAQDTPLNSYVCTYERIIIIIIREMPKKKISERNNGKIWWARDIIKETSKETGYYMGRRKGGQGLQVDTFSSDMAKSAGGV